MTNLLRRFIADERGNFAIMGAAFYDAHHRLCGAMFTKLPRSPRPTPPPASECRDLPKKSGTGRG